MKQMIICGIICLCIGISIGFLLPHTSPTSSLAFLSQSSENRQGGYKYISPLLDCEPNQIEGDVEYKPSQTYLKNYIQGLKDKHIITDVGLYYRDLNNGPWFAINEQDVFSPASLLKVPVMIAYYKKADQNPSILQKKILFTKSIGITEQFFKPENALVPNTSYTVDELIDRMIMFSDNDATWLLENNIDNNLIDKVTLDLGIATASDSTPENYMSVRSYASLYRVLYNASYLDRDYSEKALELLTKTAFPVGMAKGIPSSIAIADKFGERELDDGTKQLHDCGIIYYPNHPYLLCIMTRGTDYNQLSKVIEQISGKIYSDIHEKYH